MLKPKPASAPGGAEYVVRGPPDVAESKIVARPAGSDRGLEESMRLHTVDEAATKQNDAVALGFRRKSDGIVGGPVEGPVGGQSLGRCLGVGGGQLGDFRLGESAVVDPQVGEGSLEACAVSEIGP